MVFIEADVNNEYIKHNNLKKEDVILLKEWIDKQPHLPQLSELELIIFLHSCNFSVVMSKTTIDTYFTVRTHCAEMFKKRDPFFPPVQQAINIGIYEPLKSRTLEGYVPFYCKIMETDATKFNFGESLKVFDMSLMLFLIQEGTVDGIVIVFDMKGINFGHLARLGILTMKKFLFYLQEAIPIRLKGLHFVNVVPFIDKLLAIMKPFMNKELMDIIYFHHTESIETLYKYVPKDCLPEDLDGLLESTDKMHDKMKERIRGNAEYFAKDELKVSEESKRVGSPKNVDHIFGVDGSFKKLDID